MLESIELRFAPPLTPRPAAAATPPRFTRCPPRGASAALSSPSALIADATPGMVRMTHESFRASAVAPRRSEEHTSELQSLMRNSYAVFCLKKKTKKQQQ